MCLSVQSDMTLPPPPGSRRNCISSCQSSFKRWFCFSAPRVVSNPSSHYSLLKSSSWKAWISSATPLPSSPFYPLVFHLTLSTFITESLSLWQRCLAGVEADRLQQMKYRLSWVANKSKIRVAERWILFRVWTSRKYNTALFIKYSQTKHTGSAHTP